MGEIGVDAIIAVPAFDLDGETIQMRHAIDDELVFAVRSRSLRTTASTSLGKMLTP